MALYEAYVDWKQGVADWIDVTDGPVFDNTGVFIALAEVELDKRLRLRQAVRFVSNIIDNDGILTVPDDFAQPKIVKLNGAPDHRPLRSLTADQLFNTWSKPGGEFGDPQYYTVIGERIHFAPKGEGVEIAMSYYRKAEPLSDQVPENVYSQFAPECLLSGAVMYGCKFDTDEQRFIIWKTKFDEEILASNADAKNAEIGSSPILMRTSNRIPLRRRR